MCVDTAVSRCGCVTVRLCYSTVTVRMVVYMFDYYLEWLCFGVVACWCGCEFVWLCYGMITCLSVVVCVPWNGCISQLFLVFLVSCAFGV